MNFPPFPVHRFFVAYTCLQIRLKNDSFLLYKIQNLHSNQFFSFKLFMRRQNVGSLMKINSHTNLMADAFAQEWPVLAGRKPATF